MTIHKPAMSKHRMEAREKLSSIGKQLFKYIEFDEDEELLAEIRKHPIGEFFIIITGIFISVAVVIATSVLAAGLDNFELNTASDSSLLRGVLLIGGVVFGILGILVTVISLFIYRGNVVFVTNEKLAQVGYTSLFNKRTIQLGINSVEDVNVLQKGVLAHIFGYGSLLVETAGEMQNPEFTFVPHPYDYSQIVIQAHENYVQKYGT